MSLKAYAIVLVPLIFGFTVCRSSPDIRPLGHESMFHSIDLIDDNEIVRPQRVDIIAPVHGSHDRPSEHGMRIRRASDGGNGSSTEGEHLTGDENGLTGETSPSVVDTTIAPSSSTTESDINVDESFEAYLVDFLKKNPDVQMLRSPKDFDNQKNSWTLSVNGGQNVEVMIHLLDINHYSNHLSIRAIQQDESAAKSIVGPISPKNVQTLVVLDTQEIVVDFQFANSESKKYKGFVLTYKSIGTPPTTEPGDSTVTIPQEEYSKIKVLLEVPKAKQTNDTLNQLRLLFAQAANKFITGEKLAIEECKIENVLFTEVLHCSSSWPNAENCIQIEVAIPLKTVTNTSAPTVRNEPVSIENGTDIDATPVEYELTFAHLTQMWLLYGRLHFAENQFSEFIPPDPKNLIMLWTSISLGIIVTFLLILYCILKIDLLKDYRRMHWKMSDDQRQMCKQSEIDISMFPSPHQAVPTLFPNDLTTYSTAAAAGTGLPYEYVNQPISFSQSDFKRRGSLEESLNLGDDTIEKHEAGVVPFQSEIIDFNEPHGEDEITFSRVVSESPRGPLKFRTSVNNDSVS